MYNMKRTISIRQFISELGENFSSHMEERLLELGERCVLTRKDINYRLDLKHIEHEQHECACDSESKGSSCMKEYLYGQFVVVEGVLYFSEKCTESLTAMENPKVKDIYESIKSESIIEESDIKSKKIDDSNIDFIVDSILKICPPVSEAHLAIVRGMTFRSER
ncbi:hypothetical protein [Clostridium swellfunianum]|uniref:hypothetical protein n=1 Tax=Clostridium swellfunianum TaxID=1367462 RepID=UPI003D7C3541